jgi:GT2 family glycosyltransferase
MTPDISFIVSTYNRPEMLWCCLASLRAQTHKNIEIIVTDNATDIGVKATHRSACSLFDAQYIAANVLTCYHSAEMGVASASGTFLCFPSDDSYYVPTFAAEMLKVATERQASLVYCEMVYNPRWPMDTYRLLGAKPQLNHIDKTGFILRRDKFLGFPNKPESSMACACDGYLIDELVGQGVSHAKHERILAVHN